MTLRLLPCSTTCACDTNSSGTNGAVTNERPDEPLPMITPVPREVELLLPCVPVPLFRTDAVRIIRALDRANCRDELDELCLAFDVELFADGPVPPPFLNTCIKSFLLIFKFISLPLPLYRVNIPVPTEAYPLLGSALLRSKRSAIIVNATRSARPSSSSIPKCDGPMTICFTGVLSICSDCGLWPPYLFILSAISRSLRKRISQNEKNIGYVAEHNVACSSVKIPFICKATATTVFLPTAIFLSTVSTPAM